MNNLFNMTKDSDGREKIEVSARARNTDPRASHDAAHDMGNVTGLFLEILNDLKSNGANTSDRVARNINRNPASVSPRFAQMGKIGLIRSTGEFKKSLTSNSNREIWEVVQ